MFRGLRLQLTLVYALAALALVLLVSSGAYFVIASYFQNITDLALQHKMSHEFTILDAPMPAGLIPADRDWSTLRGDHELSAKTPTPYLAAGTADGDGDEQQTLTTDNIDSFETVAYDGELAAIFVLPLDKTGRMLFDPNPFVPPTDPDIGSLQAALTKGSDLRTVTLADGRHVRLLTYKLTRSDGPAALQLGRVINDQESVLTQLITGLLVLGAVSIVLVSAGSWWLADRALYPAQEAWERQQRFIASASHELRTPLTLIRASTEVALRVLPKDDADLQELLGDVLDESDHMRRLVDDLLTLSRLDSGQLSLSPSCIELPTLLTEIHRQVARLGVERGIAITLTQQHASTTWADGDRLRQVILILVDNALRHTPTGGSISVEASDAGQRVRLSVRDTGSGIEPEHLPHIFDRFYRADPARGRSGGNAGLGLSIAKGLVEAMGGQIGVESVPSAGTLVWFTLPVAMKAKA